MSSYMPEFHMTNSVKETLRNIDKAIRSDARARLHSRNRKVQRMIRNSFHPRGIVHKNISRSV